MPHYDRDEPKTVAELITDLLKMPMDAPVLVRGYEGGAHDVAEPRLVRAERNHTTDVHYYGPHEVKGDYNDLTNLTDHVYLPGYGEGW